jgi:hypothetical protein
MAAVTSTIVALGGLGLSAAQAIKANKDMKIASKASQDASTQLKGIKEQNAFKNVQVPTLGFDLAQEAGAQRDAQALSAIQGAGAAGVIGGVGQLAQVGQQGDLELAASAQEAQYNRDLQQANAEQGIEARRGEREFNIGMGEKQDAELRRAEAAKRRTAAINSMAASAGSALTGIGKILDKDKPTVEDPYGYKNNNSSDITENKDWKGIPYPYTPTEKSEPFDLYDYLSGKK